MGRAGTSAHPVESVDATNPPDSVDEAEPWPPDLLSRADAAYKATFARWEAVIFDIRADRALTPDQRAAAILALRERQRLEASAMRRRVLSEIPRSTIRLRKTRPSRPFAYIAGPAKT